MFHGPLTQRRNLSPADCEQHYRVIRISRDIFRKFVPEGGGTEHLP